MFRKIAKLSVRRCVFSAGQEDLTCLLPVRRIIRARKRGKKVVHAKHKILYLLLFVCIAGLALAQKKPREVQRQAPAGASVEQNKATARRVFDELFTQGRFGEVNQIYAPNCKFQFGGRSEGLSQAVSEGRGWKSAAPDLVMTANQITANGEEVTVNWTARGTQTGQGHGLKPTGK